MLFCLVLLHAGFLPALFVFLTWSLPGAIGMCALSVGVQHINQLLPAPVYALLSGLNSSTVGIIALAATQLSEKAAKTKFLRILVIFGACAGLCYNALWYFPVLMLIGGLAAVVWDSRLERWIGKMKVKWKRRKRNPDSLAEESNATELRNVESDPQTDATNTQTAASGQLVQRRSTSASTSNHPSLTNQEPQPSGSHNEVKDSTQSHETQPPTVATTPHNIPLFTGITVIIVFFISFAAVLIIRGTLSNPPHGLSVFTNFYLAGTIIFGGGPVVIPLLREYVVQPGWVSPRDFLIGLAIIQSFPGPNFNFAVFLGGLAVLSDKDVATGHHRGSWMVLGACLGYIGIFVPGLTLAVGVQSIWRVLREKSWVVGFLRGVNATAVGLVFTAVYRLWEIGHLNEKASSGESLGNDPWWLVIAALTYCASRWFGSPAAASIIGGGVLGLVWYGAVGR
jgi:chromate transport protein ChrA